MNKLALTESSITSPGKPYQSTAECWFDDACILDMDYFVKTISGIKSKGVRPQLIATFSYASSGRPTWSVWSLRTEPSWRKGFHGSLTKLIPSFSHTSGTLLDVELVIRLVKRFSGLDEGARSGIAAVKVAKLVDCYLAEAALDTNLSLDEFIALGAAIPSQARAMDDGLYRFIDTYLKEHPGVSKQDRKVLCRLIDCQKLSPEASLHAALNERLPVRAVIQVLFYEKPSSIDMLIGADCSAEQGVRTQPDLNPQLGACREINAQEIEIKKLTEELLRVQSQCLAMQMQKEKLMDKRKGFFR
ncbi:monoglyceride lipase-like [Hibiscus syriacus]|uniref:Monoglyceride lipase-like n=1 Tax=Hibiscus syriacus TaxID=106335 RepID=A0A6A2YN86_HIBSY|nr:monoglyceride lipase-like [Hibiscus syriacus]